MSSEPKWITGETVDNLNKAEARITELEEKNRELNRRCQKAESAARETLEKTKRAGMSVGRGLANWAAADSEREREKLAAAYLEVGSQKALLLEACTSLLREIDHLVEDGTLTPEHVNNHPSIVKAKAAIEKGRTDDRKE